MWPGTFCSAASSRFQPASMRFSALYCALAQPLAIFFVVFLTFSSVSKLVKSSKTVILVLARY